MRTAWHPDPITDWPARRTAGLPDRLHIPTGLLPVYVANWLASFALSVLRELLGTSVRRLGPVADRVRLRLRRVVLEGAHDVGDVAGAVLATVQVAGVARALRASAK